MNYLKRRFHTFRVDWCEILKIKHLLYHVILRPLDVEKKNLLSTLHPGIPIRPSILNQLSVSVGFSSLHVEVWCI